MGTGVCEKELFIKAIEDPSFRLSAEDKISLVLVQSAIKQASFVWFPHKMNQNRCDDEWLGQMVKVAETLRLGNLPYRELRVQEDGYFTVSFDIGKDQPALDRLVQTHISSEDMGYALGYPETAVQAYYQGLEDDLDKFAMRKDELPEIFGYLAPFTLFRPSRLHWQEEMELVRTRAETVKAVAPKLYRDMAG